MSYVRARRRQMRGLGFCLPGQVEDVDTGECIGLPESEMLPSSGTYDRPAGPLLPSGRFYSQPGGEVMSWVTRNQTAILLAVGGFALVSALKGRR